MTAKRRRPCAVVICGAGHSGSTLLGLILDGHRECFYIGEAAKLRFLHDESKPLRKRVCKLCGPECAVWSRFRWEPERPLYPQVSEHVGRAVVVDSAKNVAWIRARLSELAAGTTAALLLLVRDGRAVINSRIRKYPDRDPARQIRDWVRQIQRSTELFDAFQGPKRRVRYEELATDPEAVARQICELVGLEFEPAMLAFTEAEHHPLGGNNGTQFQVARRQFEDPDQAFVSLGQRSRKYYRNHPRGIRLDLRWKQELKPQELALFEELAGPFNQPMQWGD